MTRAWRAFTAEIERWADQGLTADFWLRDDDATVPNAALERLLRLCADAGIPLALAVIPRGAGGALFEGLGSGVDVLQHGTDHRNRAAEGEKKSEFPGSEPAEAALERLQSGRLRLRELAGGRLLDVLAPPWNRVQAPLLPLLRQAGYRGVSGYGPRHAAEAVPGLRHVNTHVDLVAWQGGRGFIGEAEALALALRHLSARRTGRADPAEPTGWLTHHAVHDEAAWGFLARLFETTCGLPAVRWVRSAGLFAG